MIIAELLRKIKEAKYGKDVRQSIVDAIQQCYDDATAMGHTDMEVEAARGEFSTLNGRLTSFENSIDELNDFKDNLLVEVDSWEEEEEE